LAADYPLLHLSDFQTFTLTVSSHVVVQIALGLSSNSPGDNSSSYPPERLCAVYAAQAVLLILSKTRGRSLDVNCH